MSDATHGPARRLVEQAATLGIWLGMHNVYEKYTSVFAMPAADLTLTRPKVISELDATRAAADARDAAFDALLAAAEAVLEGVSEMGLGIEWHGIIEWELRPAVAAVKGEQGE